MDTKDSPEITLRLGPLVIIWRSLFVTAFKYLKRSYTGERAPMFERLQVMQETEEPWRKGHGFIIRLWPSCRAFMLGYWGESQVDDSAGDRRGLAQVLQGATSGMASNIPVTQLLGERTGEEIADKVAELMGPDDEETINILREFDIQDLRVADGTDS